MKNKHCLLSYYVEVTSIWFITLCNGTGLKVLKGSVPVLLDAYEEYNIKATFFFTGYIAKLFPDIVKMILKDGHKVASHRKSHLLQNGFYIMSYEK